MFKKIVFWCCILASFIWLRYIWSSYTESVAEKWIFLIAVAIFTPIWSGFIWLINSRRNPTLVRVLEIAIVIPWVIYFLYSIFVPGLEAKGFELFLYSAYYGVFWLLGIAIQSWELRLFKE